jgi:hypothetical protein
MVDYIALQDLGDAIEYYKNFLIRHKGKDRDGACSPYGR